MNGTAKSSAENPRRCEGRRRKHVLSGDLGARRAWQDTHDDGYQQSSNRRPDHQLAGQERSEENSCYREELIFWLTNIVVPPEVQVLSICAKE